MGANNYLDQFKQKSEKLSVDPSAKLWDRLEDKLDNRTIEKKKKNKFLNLAASLAMLIGLSTFVFFTLFQSKEAIAANHNFYIEELVIDQPTMESYHRQESQREEYRKKLFNLYGSDKASDLRRSGK